MKKKRNTVGIIVTALGGAYLLGGLANLLYPRTLSDYEGATAAVFVGIAVLVVGLVLLLVPKLRKKKEPVKPEADPVPEPVKPEGNIVAPDEPVFTVTVPNVIEGETLTYLCKQVFLELYSDSSEVASAAIEAKQFEFSISVFTEKSVFSLCGRPFGYLTCGKYFDMLRDFHKRGETVKAWLQGSSDEGYFAGLAFYQDLDKKYSNHSSDMYTLKRYSSDDIQETLLLSKPGELLEFEEDEKYEERVWVTDGYNRFGSLPAPVAKKYIEEGVAAVVLHSADYDPDNDLFVPVVKIYW